MHIPEDIKAIAARKPLEPAEAETLKKAIIKYAKDYLDLKKGKNSSVNINDIVRDDFKVQDYVFTFVRDIGRRMERTRDFVMYEKEGYGEDQIIVVPLDRPLTEKYSYLFSFGGVILGAALTLMTTWLKTKIEKPLPSPIIKVEDSRISALQDSLQSLKMRLNTSGKDKPHP